MGKQGPCYHCGVTSTPLWRNGPPDKPVLCNACGSRWRTKGTLVNYTPLHSRSEADEFEDYRFSRVKTLSIKNKDAKVLKRKQISSNGFVTSGHSFSKVLEEDASNKSSSGSAVSNSESCVHLGNADASDITDPAQSIVWDTTVPSRKRTCVNREKQSSVEKLTKDLYDILHEQESYFSCSSEDLLFETDTPMVSVEIGHGSMLIRHPSSITKEEESEASSLSFDHKHHFSNQDYSPFNPHFVNNNKGIEKSKKLTGFGNDLEQMERDKFQHEKQQNLGVNSLLCNVYPKDVLNFEELVNCITDDDRLQLLKYLSNSSDNTRLPDSVRRMLDDPELKEKVLSCKKLLEEGVFDVSVGIESEEFTTLKKLTFANLTKSDWVKQYNLIKDLIRKSRGGSVVAHNDSLTAHSVNVKRSRDARFPIPGAKTTMRSPRRAQVKSNYEQKDQMENDGTCFSPKSLFALPPDNSSLMLESFQCESQNSDNDLLLLDVYSNTSFPQAELLIHSQPTTSSSSIYQNMISP